jgi:hypothetical protein
MLNTAESDTSPDKLLRGSVALHCTLDQLAGEAVEMAKTLDVVRHPHRCPG